MFGLDLNEIIVNTCKRILLHVPKMQRKARKELITDLQNVCSKCEDGYGAVIKRLKPVRAAYGNRKKLSEELLDFASDYDTRSAFKPEHLCGEIDHLLSKLRNNLDSLKYSVNFNSLVTLQRTLKSMGNYDAELYHQYDSFTSEINDISTKLQRSKGKEGTAWQQYAEDLIDDTEKHLKKGVRKMRLAKNEVVKEVL